MKDISNKEEQEDGLANYTNVTKFVHILCSTCKEEIKGLIECEECKSK